MAFELVPWRRRRQSELAWSRGGNPFLSLQREIDRLFDEFLEDFGPSLRWPSLRRRGRTWGVMVPNVDVSETDQEIEVKADLPGLDEKDIEVTLDENVLTIRGEKKEEREDRRRDYYLMERAYGSFERAIPLPGNIDAGGITARFRNGVLTVRIPKTGQEARSGKRIPVKTG
ncbi:MAG: Hsp20/alpha crystallin family protein [Verrucomicrobia bacterium]|nr:MAG: Hsp20/alpha crystallin family protein [Verrucomicrobiota bacterium]